MTTKKAKKRRLFVVYVHDLREVKYFVEALNEEDAQALVEGSTNTDADFGSKTYHSDRQWYIDHVEEA